MLMVVDSHTLVPSGSCQPADQAGLPNRRLPLDQHWVNPVGPKHGRTQHRLVISLVQRLVVMREDETKLISMSTQHGFNDALDPQWTDYITRAAQII